MSQIATQLFALLLATTCICLIGGALSKSAAGEYALVGADKAAVIRQTMARFGIASIKIPPVVDEPTCASPSHPPILAQRTALRPKPDYPRAARDLLLVRE